MSKNHGFAREGKTDEHPAGVVMHDPIWQQPQQHFYCHC
jgi:hypothetical protein